MKTQRQALAAPKAIGSQNGLLLVIFVVCGVLIMFLATLWRWGGDVHEAKAPGCDYKAVAIAEIKRAFNGYETQRKMGWQDKGAYVDVYYPLPEGHVGGSPHVHIEKSTCRVTSVYGDQ
jgi:hypothetical protein